MNNNLKKIFLMAAIALMALLPFFIRQYFEKKKEHCDYSKKIFPAEVFRIRTLGNHQNDIFFILKRDSVTDTIAYSAELGHYASDAEVKLHGIDSGKVFQYVVLDRIKGDCESKLEVLNLESY
jgi:hypothetical protein